MALIPIAGAARFRLIQGKLFPCGGEVDDLPIPFMKKTNPLGAAAEARMGLSSGGGSALVPIDESTYRLKRCGLAYDGFVDEPFLTHAMIDKKGEVFELTNKPPVGLMGVAAALSEITIADRFYRCGLSPAVRPVGMYILPELPERSSSEPVAAVLYRIESDVRVDELVYMTLSPMLVELLDSGAVSYDVKTGWWDAAGAPLSRFPDAWPDVRTRVEQVGAAAGKLFRLVHELGFLRGRGSSWFGNDVIDEGGRLSAVDFDGGAAIESDYAPALAKALKEFEMDCYCAESFWMLRDLRPSIVGLFGSDFLKGFREGCRCNGEPIVPQIIVNEILEAHMSVWPTLRQHLQFDGSIEKIRPK